MKHKLIFTIFCLVPLIMMAQKGYTIKGQITNVKQAAKIYLAMPVDGKWQDIDSADVKGGKFRLEGKVDAPTPSLLVLKHADINNDNTRRDQIAFFLENSEISIKGKDSIQNAVVAGSVANKEQEELQAKIQPLTRNIMRIQDYYAGKTREEVYIDGKLKESAQRSADTLRNLLDEVKRTYIDFVASRPESYFALYVYDTNVLASKFEPQQVEPLFHRFSPELQSSELGKQVWEKILRAKRMDIGVKATDFTQNDLAGKPFTLSSLKGKYVLVDFWASWCVPCRAENPHLVKAYEELKDSNFEVVGVSLDQDKASWENAVEVDNLPWIHVSDLKGWKNEVSMLYGIKSVPQNFLLNPDGVIIGKNIRGEGLTAKISELMN